MHRFAQCLRDDDELTKKAADELKVASIAHQVGIMGPGCDG